MLGIKVEILSFADADQTGWVECRLIDAFGRAHLFLEKIPVVSNEDLDALSSYPRDGTIACAVLGRQQGPDGREVVTVDTTLPDGVESKEGGSRFEILPEQLLVRCRITTRCRRTITSVASLPRLLAAERAVVGQLSEMSLKVQVLGIHPAFPAKLFR